MAGYLIFEIEVTDPVAWQHYRNVAGPVMQAAGGTFVVASERIEALEGGWLPPSISVVRFDSFETARSSTTRRSTRGCWSCACRLEGARHPGRQPGVRDEMSPQGGDYIIEATGLSKQFMGFLAVQNVDLRVRRNSVHALIGPNGAGKTTTFNLLTKFLAPTEGTIRYDGERHHRAEARPRWRAWAWCARSRSRRCSRA